MKFGGLILATIILAVLAGLLYWSNHASSAKSSAASEPAAPKILTANKADIAKIEIHKKDGNNVVLIKDNAGKWQITAPQAYPADSIAVESLLFSIAPLTAEQVVEDKATNLAPFGLASPSAELVITEKDGKSQRLLIGDDTPTSSGTYVALAGDPRVFTIPTYIKSNLIKDENELREKPTPTPSPVPPSPKSRK
jgi:hypothetical protein